MLKQGVSAEELGNAFAKQLNDNVKLYNEEQEQNLKKEESITTLSIIIQDAIEYIGDYYPSLLNIILPKDEYDTDELAKTLINVLVEFNDIAKDESLMNFLKGELNITKEKNKPCNNCSCKKENKTNLLDFEKLVSSYISR